jgi:hypothetical protein
VFSSFTTPEEPPRVPAAYLKRLDELKNKKRPYYLTVPERHLYGFATRWASFSDLQNNVVVDLHFNGHRLQVWGDCYREVSGWQNG